MVTRVSQQPFLKMNRLAFTLHFAFIASILFAGCTAPAHLRDKAHPSTLKLSSDEKMQQTIDRWKGTHISKAIQKWGSPKEVNDDGTGWQTYIWHIPVRGFLAGQEADIPGFQIRQDHQFYSQRRPSGMQGVGGVYGSTGYTYELTFYARPDGIISKTDIKKNYDPASELNWK